MRHLTKEEEKHVIAIKQLAGELHAAGWKAITFQYAAGGDSLSDLTLTIENEEDVFGLSELAEEDLPPSFNANDIADHFIALLPAGFEDGDGSSGEIQLDTKTKKITVHYCEYYVESKEKKWAL